MSTSIHTMNNRLLIVDDNPAIHEDFRRILSPSDFGEEALSAAERQLFGEQGERKVLRPDFQIAFASQGEEGVSLVKNAIEQDRPFAAAIVDVRMPPGIDGIQTVKKLWRVQSDLQIIVCTAYSEYSWEEMVEEVGVSHRLVVLKKPFDPIEVMQLANAMTKKWCFERDNSLRQIDLQSKLMKHAERIEQVCQELHHEREAKVQGGPVPAAQAGEQMVALNPNQASHYEAQQLDVISTLASGVAHDFNNALTVIQSHLTLPLMDRPAGAVNDVPSLESLMKTVQRAGCLTRQIMAFASKNGLPHGLQRLSLRDQAKQYSELLVGVLGEKITVEFAGMPHSEAVEVMVDEGNLSQVVVSLALHCRDEMKEGGVLSLSVDETVIPSDLAASEMHPWARPGQYAVLKLTDFEAQGQDYVEKTDLPPGEAPPRLALAEKLLSQMGGWLCQSAVQTAASSYSVYLPMVAPAVSQDGLGGSAGHEKLKILVVDDEPAICDVVSYVLTQQGHAVITARSASEAWKIWQEHERRFHLVFSDIHLPEGITGLDLCAHMKQDAPWLPVIYTSGYHPEMFGSPEELTVGVNFLPKPFDVLDLLNATGRALEMAEEKRSAAFRQPVTSATTQVKLAGYESSLH